MIKKQASGKYTAKSVDEGLALAAQDLGVLVDDLQYEVVSDTTRTIFGLVRTGEVVIRAWIKDIVDTVPGPSNAEVVTEPEVAAAESANDEPVDEPAMATEAAAEARVDTRVSAPAAERVEDASDRNPADLLDISEEVLSTLLDKMEALAAVEVVDDGGEIDPVTGEVTPLILNVVGDDLALLIGRRGDTLRDLQFITRLLVSRRLGVWPNLVVDVENYKGKREQSLRALASRMADQVRETGRPVTLEPMPAHERRIIHIVLRGEDDVYTESTGEKEHRKVRIFPK